MIGAKTLKAGIIGLGVGERHIAGYRQHDDCQVVALCDCNAQKRDEVAARYPRVRMCQAAEEILDDPEIDVVSIATYDNAHCVQVMRAIQKGKHVFVEKPLCLSEDEAREIRALLNAYPEVRLSSNMVLRVSPRFCSLKRMIDAGRLGKIYAVEGDYEYGRLAKLTDGWRGRLDYYSVVLGGAVHMVDLMLWLTGDTIEEVAAFGNRICSEGSIFRFNDMVVGIARFSEGIVGKVSANFGCVRPHFHDMKVFGDRATFVNGQSCAWLYESRDPLKAPEEIQTEYPGTRQRDLLTNFVDHIVNDAEPIVTKEDVFRAMSVCFALEKATKHGSPVEVEYI